MCGEWNFLHHRLLTSGDKDEIYYDATDWNLNTMKNNKSKNCFAGIFHFTLANLPIVQKGRKRLT